MDFYLSCRVNLKLTINSHFLLKVIHFGLWTFFRYMYPPGTHCFMPSLPHIFAFSNWIRFQLSFPVPTRGVLLSINSAWYLHSLFHLLTPSSSLLFSYGYSIYLILCVTLSSPLAIIVVALQLVFTTPLWMDHHGTSCNYHSTIENMFLCVCSLYSEYWPHVKPRPPQDHTQRPPLPPIHVRHCDTTTPHIINTQ